MDLLDVQAETVVEDSVFAELFPVIRRDDHERIAQHTAPVEFIEQRPDLTVEGRDAVVVGVAGQLHVVLAELELVPIPIVEEHPVVAARFGAEPEDAPRHLRAAGTARARRDNSGMRRRAGLPIVAPGQPVEERPIDLARRPGTAIGSI